MIRPALLALLLATPAFAVGSDDSEPPKPTPTSTDCKRGEVWDEKTSKCLPKQSSGLSDDQRYGAVRELAYAARLDEAQDMLAAMTEGDTDRVLTYRGFLARKQGDWAAGQAYYLAAITLNPDNLLVRSDMGQGLAERGDRAGAEAQLAEIIGRGGEGTWAQTALTRAITSGKGYSY
jgi:predicted Zn-dependent protease